MAVRRRVHTHRQQPPAVWPHPGNEQPRRQHAGQPLQHPRRPGLAVPQLLGLAVPQRQPHEIVRRRLLQQRHRRHEVLGLRRGQQRMMWGSPRKRVQSTWRDTMEA